jgi:alkanesulfonate monooxygenase SsuD/methylene tetrahydromethanopterin reductase-like flavin-dependent oxidoreductase (luciferase family)
VGADLPAGMRVSPSYHGTPDQVVASVLADPGISGADELVLFLPPAFTLSQNVAALTALAQEVAPALGWVAA